MARRVFINYRRDDSSATAGRLRDRLAQAFGEDNVFIDIESIPAGVDFIEYLNTEISSYDVFLVLIGPDWLDARDENGRRRLESPDDYVTAEIAAALTRTTRVVPVTIDGARMPTTDELPDPIKSLVRRNAVDVRNAHFRSDVDSLIEKIGHRAWQGHWALKAAGVAILMLLVGLIGVFLWAPPNVHRPGGETVDEGARRPGNVITRKAQEEETARKAEAARMGQEEEAARKAAEEETAKKTAAEKAAEEEIARRAQEEEAARKAAEEETAKKTAAEKAAKLGVATTIDKFTTRKNRDIYGNDIPLPEGKVAIPDLDIGACAARCDNTKSCVAFSLDRWNHRCFLKSNIYTALVNPHSIIGVKKPRELPNVSKALPELKIKRNHRFGGNPIARTRVSDFLACKAACTPDASCIAFSFLKAVGNVENCEIFNESQEGYFEDNSADSGWKQQSP